MRYKVVASRSSCVLIPQPWRGDGGAMTTMTANLRPAENRRSADGRASGDGSVMCGN